MSATPARRSRRWSLAFLGLLLASVAGSFSGCATDDAANESARPWNTPRSWEHGMPPGFQERR